MPKQQTDASRPVELSDFQKITQERVRKIFAERGRVANFEIGTIRATSITPEEVALKFTFDGYTSWIYLDGADVIGRDVDKVFEVYDFRSLDELREAYVTLVEILLEKNAPDINAMDRFGGYCSHPSLWLVRLSPRHEGQAGRA
jgi:hypothetical protein